MFPRILLAFLLLINLGMFAWFSFDTNDLPQLEINTLMLEQPADQDTAVQMQVRVGHDLGKCAIDSEAKLRWARILMLVNAVVFFLAIVFLSAPANEPSTLASTDA